jgi:hypothetical protein
LTVLLAYPLSLAPHRLAFADDPDTQLFQWILAWNAHALATNPLRIFDANIYYPYGNTLAYSENLIGSGLLAAPVVWISGNPMLAVNFVALLSTILCGIGAWLLARRLGLGPSAAIICGIVFAFAPARFFRLSQLHVGAVQWIPFALASLHAYLDHGRRRHLLLAVAFVSLQVLGTGHGAVFVLLACGLLIAWRVTLGEPVAIARRLRDLGIAGALMLVPALLVFLPYRQVQAEMGFARSLADWTVVPESFLASPATFHTWLHAFYRTPHINDTAYAFLFPGYLAILLAALLLVLRPMAMSGAARERGGRDPWLVAARATELALLVSLGLAVWISVSAPIRLRAGGTVLFRASDPWRVWMILVLLVGARLAMMRRVPLDFVARLAAAGGGVRRWAARRRQDAVTFYALLTTVCILLIVDLPFGLWPFVYWVPGFNLIRAPSRFMVLAMLGLAVLAAFGFERLASRLRPARARLLAAAAALLLVAEFSGIPLHTVAYNIEIPAVDRWLAGQPKPFVVAEVPVRPYERYHSTYMLHSMAHWQKTVHGYSGFRPPLHEKLYDQLRGFPDEESVEALRRLGVNYVVAHTDWYGPGEWEEVEARLEAFADIVRLVHTDGPGRVYAIH